MRQRLLLIIKSVTVRVTILGWVVLSLRFALGALLIVAGLMKVGSIPSLAATITAFRLLPSFFIAPVAVILPFGEIVLGGYLLLGLLTRIVATIVLGEFLLFSAAIASVVARGITIPCGCFGPLDIQPASWFDVWRDLGLAVATLPILLAAPGHYALDTLLQRRALDASSSDPVR